jgi:hypothetical protein
LILSPGAFGISEGAITSQAMPIFCN